MLRRYLKAQLIVLLCGGLVGPIFLAVYFALGPMARPAVEWMFWTGLVITALDVLIALGQVNLGLRAEATHEQLARKGVMVLAPVTAIADTSWFVNDQQMIKVMLRIEVPGLPGFDAQETMAASPTRMQVLNARKLVVLVEPDTRRYEIDWNASALIAGVVPAQFGLDEDGRTYDLTGQSAPVMRILQVLHLNGIPLSGTIDIRSTPLVRQQVMDIVRRAGSPPAHPADAEPPPPSPRSASAQPPTIAQRLQELATLHATGVVTDAEYATKRQEILADL